MAWTPTHGEHIAMHRSTLIFCWFSSALIFAISGASAASFSEFATGVDISSNPAAPMPFMLEAGGNQLLGSASSRDFDFLRVTVPANHKLDSLVVVFHDDVNQIFAGVQAGGTWTAGTGGSVDNSQLLGWVNFPTNPHHGGHTGEDILDDMGAGAGSIGFAAPLASGVYTFLFQTGTSAVSYGLSFNVSQIGASLPGDFNGDLVVDGADLDRWRSAFGRDATADANNDGVTDGLDFLIWQRNVGLTGAPPAAHAIPEAAGVVLAGGALAGLALDRRRARSPHHRRRFVESFR